MTPCRRSRGRSARTLPRTITIALCCALLVAALCCPLAAHAQDEGGDPGQTVGGGEAPPPAPTPTTPTPTTPDPAAGNGNGNGNGNGDGNGDGNGGDTSAPAAAAPSDSSASGGDLVGPIPLWSLLILCITGGLLLFFCLLRCCNPRGTTTAAQFDVIIFFLALGDFFADVWFIYSLRSSNHADSSDPPPSILFQLAIVFTFVPFGLNLLSLAWLIWREMANLAFRRWLNHHFAVFTGVVLTSCTNVDAMFLLDSHACGLRAFKAPWSDQLITKLRMLGFITIVCEDIPQTVLQIFVISTTAHGWGNLIALCFSITTILFGVTKRVLVCCVYQFDSRQQEEEQDDVEWGAKPVIKQGESTTIVNPTSYSNFNQTAATTGMIAGAVGTGAVIAAHQQPTSQNKLITAEQDSKNVAPVAGAPLAGAEGLSAAQVETAPPSVATTPQSRFRSLNDRSTHPDSGEEGPQGGLGALAVGTAAAGGVASTTAAHHTSPTTSSSSSSRLDQLQHPAASPSPSNLQQQQQQQPGAAPVAGFSSHAAASAQQSGGSQSQPGTPRLGLRTSRSLNDNLVDPAPSLQQTQQLDLSSPRDKPMVPPRPPSTHLSPAASTRRLSGSGAGSSLAQQSSNYYSPQLSQRSLVQPSAPSDSPPIPTRPLPAMNPGHPLQLQTQSAEDAAAGVPIVAPGRPPAFTVSSNAFVRNTQFAPHAEFERMGPQQPAPHEITLADLMRAH